MLVVEQVVSQKAKKSTSAFGKPTFSRRKVEPVSKQSTADTLTEEAPEKQYKMCFVTQSGECGKHRESRRPSSDRCILSLQTMTPDYEGAEQVSHSSDRFINTSKSQAPVVDSFRNNELLMVRLHKLFSLAPRFFTALQIEKMQVITNYLLDFMDANMSEFRNSLVPSLFNCMAFLIASKMGMSKNIFNKMMNDERNSKINVRTDKIKNCKKFAKMREAFKNMTLLD